MIPGFRFLRRLVLFVAVLGLLFVGVNVVAARVAEGKIADAAQHEFGLPQRPVIHIGGFILLDVVRGTLPSLTFDVGDVVENGLKIASVHAELDGIKANGIFSRSIKVSVETGSMRATVAQSDLNDYLRRHVGHVSVVLRPEGAATVHAVRGGHTYVANGTLRLDVSVLRFDPASVTVDGHVPPPGFEAFARQQATFHVQIPELPGQIKVARLETATGSATFTAMMKRRTFAIAR